MSVVVPIQRKSFQGIVRPGIFDPRGTSVRPTEPGETTPTHWQRLEATRQWLVGHGKYGQFAADVLVEQFHRLQAIKSWSQSLPDGDVKDVLTRLLDGKLTVVKM